MRKLVIFLVALFLVTPAFAGGHSHGVVIKKYYHTITNITNVTNVTDESSRNEYGAMLDMPNLIRLNKQWTIGIEGGKDFNGTSNDEGYFAYGKVTWSGTVLNLGKGE